jgi:hypothetical protein
MHEQGEPSSLDEGVWSGLRVGQGVGLSDVRLGEAGLVLGRRARLLADLPPILPWWDHANADGSHHPPPRSKDLCTFTRTYPGIPTVRRHSGPKPLTTRHCD